MVDRCVCFSVSFEWLKPSGLDTIEGIQQTSGCGLRCGLCIPYIQLMLDTGRTVFKVGEPARHAAVCVEMEK